MLISLKVFIIKTYESNALNCCVVFKEFFCLVIIRGPSLGTVKKSQNYIPAGLDEIKLYCFFFLIGISGTDTP